jgi:hypothetical protein
MVLVRRTACGLCRDGFGFTAPATLIRKDATGCAGYAAHPRVTLKGPPVVSERLVNPKRGTYKY